MPRRYKPKRKYTKFKTTIAKNVASLRRDAGLSQSVLAKRARIRLITLQFIEQGLTRDPKVSTAVRLARALGVTIGVLCGVEKPME